MTRMMSLLFSLAMVATLAQADNIEPLLLEQLSTLDSEERIEVMVIMSEQLDGESIIRHIKDKPTRRNHTIAELKALAGRSQAGLLAELEGHRLAGRVGRVIPFWLVNAVYCEVSPELVHEFARRPEVMAVQWDKIPTPNALNFEPVATAQDMLGRRARGAVKRRNETFQDSGGLPRRSADEYNPVTWNVAKVKADSVWIRYGITGAGIVIGNIDTGVDYTHPDLAGRMWTDPNYPKYGWNFNNDNDDPMDASGHGTHVAGTHSGDGTSGQATGMAPGSSIMALRTRTSLSPPFPDTITENTVLNAIQFALEPPLSPDNHADLLTMSLGFLVRNWQPRQALWRSAVTNVAAAGLPYFIAGGNERNSQGPPYSIRCPGNVPSPWHHPADQPGGLGGSITIGATDRNDNIAGFSSPGPTLWDTIAPYLDYPYPPGLMKPDFSVPGANITSTKRGGGYTEMSGTSMATPGAAGIAALMLEKNSNLLPEEINEIMEMSVVPLGREPKNNDFGTGRICALLAVENTPYSGHDVEVWTVLSPKERIDSRVALTPKVVIRNRGIYDEPNVPVHCRIDSLGTEVYFRTVTMAVDSGRADTAVFPDWQTGPSGKTYTVTFWHSLANDTNRRNDTVIVTTTTRAHDVRTERTNLYRRVRANAAINPLVTLSSVDYTERDFSLWLKIEQAGTTVYYDSLRVDSVPEHGERTFRFARPAEVGQSGGMYDVRAWHNCPTDENRGNDTLVTTFEAVNLIRVLWMYSDFGPPDSTLGVHLRALGDSIDYHDARLTTPTHSQLEPYHVVGVHSNFSFDDPDRLGDLLADFADAGGGVVIGNRAFTTDRGLAGRLMTGDYATINRGANLEQATTIGWRNETHRLMQGVGTVTEGIAAGGGFNPAAESIARWEDGRPYVAVSRNRRVVGVNSYPGVHSNPARTGDWLLVFVNALHFAAGSAAGVEEFDPFRPVLKVELDAAPSIARRGVSVNYALPTGQEYQLGIYDINGRLVRTLARGTAQSGVQRLSWDIADDRGRRVGSGVYFCRLTAGDRTETRKLIIE